MIAIGMAVVWNSLFSHDKGAVPSSSGVGSAKELFDVKYSDIKRARSGTQGQSSSSSSRRLPLAIASGTSVTDKHILQAYQVRLKEAVELSLKSDEEGVDLRIFSKILDDIEMDIGVAIAKKGGTLAPKDPLDHTLKILSRKFEDAIDQAGEVGMDGYDLATRASELESHAMQNAFLKMLDDIEVDIGKEIAENGVTVALKSSTHRALQVRVLKIADGLDELGIEEGGDLSRSVPHLATLESSARRDVFLTILDEIKESPVPTRQARLRKVQDDLTQAKENGLLKTRDYLMVKKKLGDLRIR